MRLKNSLAVLLLAMAESAPLQAKGMFWRSDLDGCAATGHQLLSGTTLVRETFGNAAVTTSGYDPVTAPCWKNFRSNFSSMASSDIQAAFTTGTFVSGPVNTRKLSLTYASGISTNTTVAYAPFSSPNTGDRGQWPYSMELLRNKQCYADVTVTARMKSFAVETSSTIRNYGIAMNVRADGEGSTRKISGYFMHVNTDGDSLTMTKFHMGPDHAFDFFDNFPGYLGRPNPITDGPYTGWNFTNSVKVTYASGYSKYNFDGERLFVARYRYNLSTQVVPLDYEVRGTDGTDGTPGYLEHSLVISGEHALPPGGAFGYWSAMYGKISGAGDVKGVEVSDVLLECNN